MKRLIPLIMMVLLVIGAVLPAHADDTITPNSTACGWFMDAGYETYSISESETESCVMYYLTPDSYSVSYDGVVVQYDNNFSGNYGPLTDMQIMRDFASLSSWIEDSDIGPALTLIGASDNKAWTYVMVGVVLSSGETYYAYGYDVSDATWVDMMTAK